MTAADAELLHDGLDANVAGRDFLVVCIVEGKCLFQCKQVLRMFLFKRNNVFCYGQAGWFCCNHLQTNQFFF